MRSVKIAGKDYELRYALSTRQKIEDLTKKPLFDSMFGGLLSDQATVLWAGIQHTDRRLTPSRVIDMLEEHQKADPEASYDDVCREAFWAVFEARMLGKLDRSAMRKLLGEDEGEAPAQG